MKHEASNKLGLQLLSLPSNQRSVAQSDGIGIDLELDAASFSCFPVAGRGVFTRNIKPCRSKVGIIGDMIGIFRGF